MKHGLWLGLAVIALLPGCGAEKPDRPAAIAVAPAQPPEIGKAIAALEKGDWKKARKLLAKSLKKLPGNAAAAKLLRQIDSDPKVLLGALNFAYQARPGDSYRSLAQRYLGDPLMFYALAHYNGVSAPDALQPGAMLRIPGALQSAEPKPFPARPDRPAKAAAKPAPAAGKAVAKPAAPKAHSSAQLAAVLRRQGLSALAKGNPGAAVAYLQRAAAADPADKLVAADLSRARRVRDAVSR